MSENLLAIDNGTQSVRALLFDPRGNLLNKSRVQIEPYYSTAPGLAEEDPEVFWKAICEACRGLWSQGVNKSSIAAFALTTQRSTLINVDKNGKPLGTIRYTLDEAGRFMRGEVYGPDDQFRFKTLYRVIIYLTHRIASCRFGA